MQLRMMLAERLESAGIGKPSGMALPLGAAEPDLQSGPSRGVQHVVQDVQYALRTGFPLILRAMKRMFAELDIDGSTVDHFIPGVSSMQVARRLEERFREQFGVREASWRLNFTRVGYLGGAGFLVMLDELVRSGSVKPGELVCAVAEESSKWMVAGAVFRWNP